MADSREYAIWKILEGEGRSMRWLARKAGVSQWTVYHVKLGDRPATEDFKGKCERALNIPKDILFSLPPRSATEQLAS